MATTVAVTTPDSVNTRIGDLTFERGFSTEETKRKVFDEIERGTVRRTWKLPDVELTN